MINLAFQAQVLIHFRIFDYLSIQACLKNQKDLNSLNQKKKQYTIWATLLTQELLQNDIDFSSVQILFNKSLEKCEEITSSNFKDFELHLFYEYMLVLEQNKRYTNNKRVNMMISFMLINLHNSQDLLAIASAADISCEYAISLFQRNMNTSVMNFYYYLKIQRAEFLLINSSHSLTYISHLLCFTDQSHFSKRFKKQTGMTPNEYRNNFKNENSFISFEISTIKI